MEPTRVIRPTEVAGFLRCGRRWWFRFVMDIIDPPGVYAVSGSRIHDEIERWFNDQPPKTDDADLLARVEDACGKLQANGISRRAVRMGEVLVEKRFKWDGGIPDSVLSGRPDLMDVKPHGLDGRVRVFDYKTTGDIRKWAMKPEELKLDVQLLFYAHLMATQIAPDVDGVAVHHLYIERKPLPPKLLNMDGTRSARPRGRGFLRKHRPPPVKPRGPSTKLVGAWMSREWIMEHWAVLQKTMREMLILEQEPFQTAAPANTEECWSFGKLCPYARHCIEYKAQQAEKRLAEANKEAS